jgi:hypothetical protein
VNEPKRAPDLSIVVIPEPGETTPAEPSERISSATDQPDLLPLALGAGLGLAVEGARLAGRALQLAVRSAGFVASVVVGPEVLARAEARVRSRLETMDARWLSEREARRDDLAELASRLVPQIVDAVVKDIDLTALALENLDVDRLVAEVDVDAIVARVDLDRVVARVDLDQVVDRLDLEEIVGRMDLASLSEVVITEIDLPEIIRRSTGAVTSETVRTVRMQGIGVDRAVRRTVDRILMRRGDAGDQPGDRGEGEPEADAEG